MKSLCLLLCFSCVIAIHAQNRPNKRSGVGENGPMIGATAPDFTLKTLAGAPIHAADLWAEKPTLILTGSHTCPVFRGKVPDIEHLAKEFAGRVNILLVYTIEAHPKGSPSPYSGREWITPKNEEDRLLLPQPADLAARIAQARACITREKLTVPVVVDTMDNAVWKAYGSAPNCGYVISTDGKIVEAQPWMNPERLRQSLNRLLR